MKIKAVAPRRCSLYSFQLSKFTIFGADLKYNFVNRKIMFSFVRYLSIYK
jgi:hypothetical protein